MRNSKNTFMNDPITFSMIEITFMADTFSCFYTRVVGIIRRLKILGFRAPDDLIYIISVLRPAIPIARSS